MGFKKGIHEGVEYHYPEKFDSVQEYLASLEPVVIDAESASQIAWSNIRQKRDRLMAETDWTQTIDSPLTEENKAEFVEYRKKLRDIPQAFSSAEDVSFPIKPVVKTV